MAVGSGFSALFDRLEAPSCGGDGPHDTSELLFLSSKFSSLVFFSHHWFWPPINTDKIFCSRWTTRNMLNPRLSLPVLFTWFLGQAFADVTNLANLNWTLSNANGTINIPSAGPPTQVHIDLLNAGLITEPLLEINGIWADVFWYSISNSIEIRFYSTLDRGW